MKKYYKGILQNMKINYNPLALFYALYMPVKYKTGIIGLWQDKGKIYKDNIKIENIALINKGLFKSLINKLFNAGEKAVFYKNVYNEAIILNQAGQEIKLKYRIAIIENRLKASYIKILLNQHNGLTIYRLKDNKYLIEIYK